MTIEPLKPLSYAAFHGKNEYSMTSMTPWWSTVQYKYAYFMMLNNLIQRRIAKLLCFIQRKNGKISSNAPNFGSLLLDCSTL